MYNGGTMPLIGCKGTAIFRQNKKKSQQSLPIAGILYIIDYLCIRCN